MDIISNFDFLAMIHFIDVVTLRAHSTTGRCTLTDCTLDLGCLKVLSADYSVTVDSTNMDCNLSMSLSIVCSL